MTRNELNRLMLEISPLDKTASDAAQQYLDSLSKPPGSLGGLERIACQLAGITGQVANTLDKRRVVVLAADNGVVAEGVSSAPQSVTAMQVASTLNGVTGVAVLAQCFGSEVSVIDLGIAQELWHPKLLNRAIRRGTGNIAVEPAMTTQQALEAVAVGIAAARTAKEDGCKVLGVGEIGIGNTTTSGAVLAALLGLRGSAIDTVCGRGAGLDEAGFAKKLATVHRALETN
ncbi:MAG: nicotinate-nucleotide--dimethylbenzimidazole phosphoribosyltransferase, partial [Angelakisella sp.]